MQIQKGEIRRRLIDAARKEFIEKGFEKASMRQIAKVAEISTSNVYNYFKNKDDLFSTIVNPTVEQVMDFFEVMENGDHYKDPERWSYESHLNRIPALADFIDYHRTNLNLLVFQSFGSSYENLKDILIERYTASNLKYMHNSKALYPGIKSELSRFCIHNIASLNFNIITEVLMHNTSKKEMESLFEEMLKFMFYGYEGLMEYDFESMTPKPRRCKNN